MRVPLSRCSSEVEFRYDNIAFSGVFALALRFRILTLVVAEERLDRYRRTLESMGVTTDS